MSTIALAECIRLAANIRETGFDRDGAAKCQLDNIALPKHMLDKLDYSSFYTISLRDACTKAEESYADFKGLGDVVYMLLDQNWNEALEWANKTLREQIITAKMATSEHRLVHDHLSLGTIFFIGTKKPKLYKVAENNMIVHGYLGGRINIGDKIWRAKWVKINHEDKLILVEELYFHGLSASGNFRFLKTGAPTCNAQGFDL